MILHSEYREALTLRISIRDTASAVHWHNNTYTYFESFGMGNIGHAVLDDLFGSYMAFRLFGFDPVQSHLGILLNRDCEDAICTRAFYGWGRGLTSAPLHRPSLPGTPGDMHCFSDLIVGVGQFSCTAGLSVRKGHGKAFFFRDFRTSFYRGLGVRLPNINSIPAHRVLINKKREGRRKIVNFEEVAQEIEAQLGLAVDFTPEDLFLLPVKAQIELLFDYTVILTPVGTISMRLFFCRPGRNSQKSALS